MSLLVVIVSCAKEEQKVIAKVGNEKITQGQLNAFLAHKRVPLQDEKLVEAQFTDYLDREVMASAIKSTGLLDETLLLAEVREFEKQARISRYFDQFLSENVSDQALRNYYSSNLDKYSSKQVHVAHILIRLNRNALDADKSARLTLANEALTLLNRGASFEDVALSHSDDIRTSKKGGDLGWIAEGAVSTEFSKAAFSLAKGEISQPIETQIGYHIIKVIEAPKSVQRSFDSVKGDIRYQLRMEAKKAEQERLLGLIKVKRS